MTTHGKLSQTSAHIRSRTLGAKRTFVLVNVLIKLKEKVEIQLPSVTLQLNKRHKMLYAPLHFKKYKSHALLDTGAVESAMSGNKFRKIQAANPETFLKELPGLKFKIQKANGTLVTVKKQVRLRFFIANHVFEKTIFHYRLWEKF